MLLWIKLIWNKTPWITTYKTKTIKQINISQNNLIRYTLGIPYKTHIKNPIKELGIIDSETTYLMEKCTIIKLLHRTEISKRVLIKNIEEKHANWWFYKEISKNPKNYVIILSKQKGNWKRNITKAMK